MFVRNKWDNYSLENIKYNIQILEDMVRKQTPFMGGILRCFYKWDCAYCPISYSVKFHQSETQECKLGEGNFLDKNLAEQILYALEMIEVLKGLL